MKKTCKEGATLGVGDLNGLTGAELTRAEAAVKACAHCAQAKAHRNPLGHHGLDKGSQPGEVVHMDTYYAVNSHCNHRQEEDAVLPAGYRRALRVAVGKHA